MYLIGYDIGSSSIKAALVDARDGRVLGMARHPEMEMPIDAPQSGWAEQRPEDWWAHVCAATRNLLRQTGVEAGAIAAHGIAYQMHGLVLVDSDHRPLRPSIIWCDSRAVDIGRQAFDYLGRQACLRNLLNSPGNFTASKLRWVKENEPRLLEKAHRMLLPGDYIALCFTGEANTTISGLSEGILWDFQRKDLARQVLEHYGIDELMLPEIVPTFSIQGRVSPAAAAATGLPASIPVAYRAGDQPNNALSLKVLEPGEVAATGGTSGVVYAVTDEPLFDARSRVNGFAHVNYTRERPRVGVLMCVNGAGIQYSWLKRQVAAERLSYAEMEALAASTPPGADGLSALPFGNGAERILDNRNPGAWIAGINFNRHTSAHLLRAGLEGVAFAFAYGMDIMRDMGLRLDIIRVGNDNLFQSRVFGETVATLGACRVEMFETAGAIGAARGAGVGAGLYSSLEEAFHDLQPVGAYEPAPDAALIQSAYQRWRETLAHALNE
jgi:xylulokinase